HALVRTPNGWRIGREISESDTQGYRITHHDLTVRIVPAKHSADIRDTFTVLRLPGARPVALLRLSDDFRVTSLQRNGRSLPFRQAGGIVAVKIPPGKTARLEMAYAGAVSHPAFSDISPTLAVMDAYYYPTL